jgi:hypothetical protein
LQVGYAVFVVVEREECIVLVGGVDRFFLKVRIDHTALVVGKVITITKDIPNVTRAFLSRALTR